MEPFCPSIRVWYKRSATDFAKSSSTRSVRCAGDMS